MEDLMFDVLCNVVIDYATKLEMSESEARRFLIQEQGATLELWNRITAEDRVKAAFLI